ncbi:IS110 family transposase [Candidatus Dependentiae bacterium]|nr:IS110 family transposase [Candidatus Dependentiae bacterium]
MQANGFLGIDVSKGYADFLLLDQHKQVMEESFQLQDNKAGRSQLGELIEKWFSMGLEMLYCGVESTGGYENNWYHYLKTLSQHLNLKVARLNAKAVKAVSDASLKRTITDEVSAENIAGYLIGFPEKIDYGKCGVQQTRIQFQEGRKQYTYVRMLQKQKVQLTNQLEKLLYQYFSEVLVYCRHRVPGWLLRMLSSYPCAASVVRAGEKKLSSIKGISIDKAKALIQKATLSEQAVSKQIGHVIAATSKEILHKDQLLKAEKNFLVEMNRESEDVKLLISIPCIGEESAVALMMEIENIGRFELAKKLTAYFGVHPTYKQSGDGIWATHMSKKGRSEVRAVLYMAAMTGIRHNVILKQIYTRFRAKGMKHYQAMGVVMHKLLRIIYGVLKTKTKFDAAIDQKNMEQAEEKQKQNQQKIKESKEIKQQKKHRYQSATPQDESISRRAAQKRKKQAASQAS